MTAAARAAESAFLARTDFSKLLATLRELGFRVVGPTVEQAAIVYAEIDSVEQLPRGIGDEQSPGRYRLIERGDDRYFGYVVGPQSWKRYLFPPEATVARAKLDDDGWHFPPADEPPPHYAFLGVRACELAAIAVQDRVFAGETFVDPIYVERRKRCCLIAVECTQAATTCFCTSMGTGPKCPAGFDLALTELDDGFTVAVGTDLGRRIVERLPVVAVDVAQLRQAAALREQAVVQISKHLQTAGLPEALQGNPEHPRWQQVAERCLSCANCTMVCPTCFCSTVDEVGDLAGPELAAAEVERRRRWDSCFNFDFSYINGGVVRNSVRSRYRQWLTHKLSTWIDQYGTSGCVGCGRCITWCPVGIDLTEEAAAIAGAATTPEGNPAS